MDLYVNVLFLLLVFILSPASSMTLGQAKIFVSIDKTHIPLRVKCPYEKDNKDSSCFNHCRSIGNAYGYCANFKCSCISKYVYDSLKGELNYLFRKINYPERLPCTDYQEVKGDKRCQDRCVHKGYTYGVCSNFMCTCI